VRKYNISTGSVTILVDGIRHGPSALITPPYDNSANTFTRENFEIFEFLNLVGEMSQGYAMCTRKSANAFEVRRGFLPNDALIAKLHTLKHSLLELLVVDLLAGIIGVRFAVEGEEGSEIEFG